MIYRFRGGRNWNDDARGWKSPHQQTLARDYGGIRRFRICPNLRSIRQSSQETGCGMALNKSVSTQKSLGLSVASLLGVRRLNAALDNEAKGRGVLGISKIMSRDCHSSTWTS
jgi:hypothetical protein